MNYQIELRHLQYFKILAEELHFRKAAERLFIAQPGLTRQIKQMEEIYGTPLFDRGKRFVRLTTAGEYLKTEVDLLFNHLDNIKNQLEKITEGKITSIKIGFIGSAVQTILPKLLKELKEKHPLIDITLNEMSNEMQIELINNNKLDLGFVRLTNNNPILHSIPVVTEHFLLVLPKNYPLKNQKKIDLRDFKHENFILFSKEYSNSYYDLMLSIFRDHGFEPNVALRTVNAMSIFNFVAQGLGIAIVPASLPHGYQADVDFISLTNIPQRTTLYLIWNAQNRNPGIPIVLETYKNLEQ